jgi:methyltransferase (TIGR00027 family)
MASTNRCSMWPSLAARRRRGRIVARADHLGTLALSAWWTAGARAVESRRIDRLFDDPWAAFLIGERYVDSLSEQRLTRSEVGAADLYAVVTRFFDDFLVHVTTDCGVRQVVLLASGLDTRPFRLTWPPGTELFELEQPALLTYKDVRLAYAGAAANCVRHGVSVDLTRPWEDSLRAAGFDSSTPSVWLLEGFLYFLAETAVLNLLAAITALAAPASWIGLDVVNKGMLDSTETRHWNESMTASGVPWLFSCDEPEALLARFGWCAHSTEPGDGAAAYGRTPYVLRARSQLSAPRSLLVTATR